MLFRKLCKHPSMFKTIDMYPPDAFYCLPYNVNLMTRYAVDRSAGQLDDIYLEYLCDDETLMYVAERSLNLRHLRLGHYIYVSDEGLIEAVQKLPMLEEVQLILCSFSDETVEALGRALPRLRSFSLTQVGSKKLRFLDDEDPLSGNEEALAIAKSMPELHHLQLIGNYMTNVGLQAILDGCPLLESLDLRACFHIDLSGGLGNRCKALKHLRLPHDSTKDYGRQAYAEQEGFGCMYVGQEHDYDSDGYSFYPGFNDFMGPWDEYSDYFDDDDEFALCYDCFGLDGIVDYASSDC